MQGAKRRRRRSQRQKERTVEIDPTRILELVSSDGKKKKMTVPAGVEVRSKARGM
jgi:hypothetical protein